jgi:hypothetical protein
LAKSTHTLLETDPVIIKMEVEEGIFYELQDVEQAHQAHLQLSEGKSFCVLLDTQKGYFNVQIEAFRKIASPEYAKHLKASAFVVTSMPARLAGNFFIRFVKPTSPTKIFSTQGEAMTWLRTFRD